jgi:hypothetical protein
MVIYAILWNYNFVGVGYGFTNQNGLIDGIPASEAICHYRYEVFMPSCLSRHYMF